MTDQGRVVLKAVGTVLSGLTVILTVAIVPAVAGEEAAQVPSPAAAPTPTPPASPLPYYLKDRDTGIPTSMFGSYIRKGELIIYPFYEYYRDNDLEYKPSEFGAPVGPGDIDYRGRYRANEGILLLAYGLTENIALEMEAAVIDASFEKAPQDTSALPSRIEESGLGDVEGQFRWRWRKENERRPELFSYFEFVIPHAQEKVLIGTPGWELKLGTGLIRGFRWGTMTVRAAIDYTEESASHFDVGEYAVEYLKRLSPHWRLYAGFEGTQDELSLITELQWHLNRHVVVKLNNGLGITSKATDWDPEVGILFNLPTR
jgi:hypothetical protein